MLLDRSQGALVCCLAIGLYVALMHLEQACFATLVNQNMKRIVTYDLALYWLSSLWKSNRFLKGLPVEPIKNRQEH